MAPRPFPGAIRAATPLFIPVVPFALVLGVAINESTMPAWLGWSSNLIIFAGSAQLVTVTLVATSTWLTVVATATVVNLRHAMYSAALAPRFRNQPRWFRWLGPWVLIDQLFVIVSDAPHLDDDDWRRFYLTAGLFFLALWTAAVTVGIFVGSAIPTEWRLGIAPAIMFAGLVVLGATTRPAVVAAVTGAGVCLVSLGVPNNGGILIGSLAGVVAGYLADPTPTDPTATDPTATDPTATDPQHLGPAGGAGQDAS